MRSTPINARCLSAFIDHTLLKADATAAQIENLCLEARAWHFFSVCINGSWIQDARRLLAGSDVKVVSVTGFPLGAGSSEAKQFETESAVRHGAQEIDCVLNVGRLKQKDDLYVLRELSEIVKAAGGAPVKVILETCLLNNEEKVRACRIVVDSGAHFVKTSTGLLSGGATVADVRLLREAVGPAFGVKASGGIRDAETALTLIEAGATRIGTSAGISILRGLEIMGS
jgi:deoxyribose-phosphate aldolase